MTKQEKRALLKIIEATRNVIGGEVVYEPDPKTGKYTRTEMPPMVPGRSNQELMDDPAYKAGYKRCHEQVAGMLGWMLNPSTKTKDLIKFAGRAK